VFSENQNIIQSNREILEVGADAGESNGRMDNGAGAVGDIAEG